MNHTLDEYIDELMKAISGIKGFSVLYGTVDEQLREEGSRHTKFISVAPTTTPEPDYGDTRKVVQIEQEFMLGFYATRALRKGSNVARQEINDAYWLAHRTLRGLDIFGMPILLGAGERQIDDINAERYELPVTIRITEFRDEC